MIDGLIEKINEIVKRYDNFPFEAVVQESMTGEVINKIVDYLVVNKKIDGEISVEIDFDMNTGKPVLLHLNNEVYEIK